MFVVSYLENGTRWDMVQSSQQDTAILIKDQLILQGFQEVMVEERHTFNPKPLPEI